MTTRTIARTDPIAGADTTVPATMRAIDPASPGGPEVLEPVERPVPTLAAGEVLIRVAAAGVNRPDVLQRQGTYPPPPGASSVLGLECAGTVVAVAEEASAHLIGQPMMALVAGGAYADYCAAPAGQCLPIPPALSLTEAAAIPETLFTVWTNLFERAYAIEGDRVLVHGGTSGIGTMAVALSRVFGLTTFVTCGSDEKCAAAGEWGAHAAINYKTEDFVERVAALTDGHGVDVVLDMVGGDYLARNLACLADEGRHVSIAFQRGMEGRVSIVDVMRRRLTLTGSTLRARSVEFKSMVADEIAGTVGPHLASGALRPAIDRVFPLAQARAAHERMEAGDHMGKIVLDLTAD